MDNLSPNSDVFSDNFEQIKKDVNKKAFLKDIESKEVDEQSKQSSSSGKNPKGFVEVENISTQQQSRLKVLTDKILIPTNPAFESAKESYSLLAFDQEKFLRQSVLLRLFALILAACFMGDAPVETASLIVIGRAEPLLVVSGLTSLAAVLFNLWSYILAGRGAYRQGTWTLVIGFFFAYGYASWLFGSTIPLVVGFAVILNVIVILMRGFEILMLTAIVLLFGSSLYVGEQVLGFYQIPLALPHEVSVIATLGLYAVGIPAITALNYFPHSSQFKALGVQNNRLQHTLTALEVRQNTSQIVSQEVLSLAEGLNITSEQQAAGSLRQVGAIAQVSAAMTELGTAATHIAELAEQVSQAAAAMGDHTEEIEVSTQQAASQTELGLAAAESTVTTSEEVAGLYEGLLVTTEDLATKTAEMQRIMTLTGTIATEIHLLSLNAAIEAAGAGQHGDRFRVVAQAVKDLAQRSFTASTEVIGVVSQVEAAVQLATASTQQGFEKARKMAQIARRTGDVITGLQHVADRSQNQAVLIASMLDEVQGQIKTIRTATFQQKHASHQVQNALHELNDLAKDVAQGSKVISNNSEELRGTAEHLKLTLFEKEFANY
jgi:methyl-accepting chemotaxis protein